MLLYHCATWHWDVKLSACWLYARTSVPDGYWVYKAWHTGPLLPTAMESRFSLRMANGHGCRLCANRRVRTVLPDDRIILLDVNYPASMGPPVNLLEPQWIIDDSHMTRIAGNSSHSEATGQSMFLQPFSFVVMRSESLQDLGRPAKGLREALTSEVSVSFCGSDHNRETFVVDVRQGHNGECRNFSQFYMYFMCFFMAYILHVLLYIFFVIAAI